MDNINLSLTPAVEAYLIALIYRNIRTSCLSLAALCSWVSHDSWPQRFGQASGHLKQVTAEVRIIKDGKRYWVTNDLSLGPAQIKRVCRNRQQIEETFRLLKQEVGWGGSSVRKATAQTAHLHLGLMALCLTQQAALSQGQTVYAFKRGLFRQPVPTQLPFLDHFSVAA